ncbi:hypothetical protein SISNIDRAFT_82462 [Sistotremastrum niveocremeum HHB9708]|uniref:RING-type domain-containing protein n=2 Tax=Sistotremastraceae TaxID=3402574 RepID=A0A164UPV1_9AGAM|nr:hypothetical protein SISNIDRAFT_82462 [Sistotremastrum niveocremeum HHB9708]KZT43760.1 hypothetical protein SISSUDRAFT_495526 [Sistotremastrum suecicum HHB10207 ss-3]
MALALSHRSSRDVIRSRSQSPSSSIKEELRCGICMETFNTPYTIIPCLHSFCRPCLVEWWRERSDCPSCRNHSSSAKYAFQLQAILSHVERGRSRVPRHLLQSDDHPDDSEIANTNEIFPSYSQGLTVLISDHPLPRRPRSRSTDFRAETSQARRRVWQRRYTPSPVMLSSPDLDALRMVHETATEVIPEEGSSMLRDVASSNSPRPAGFRTRSTANSTSSERRPVVIRTPEQWEAEASEGSDMMSVIQQRRRDSSPPRLSPWTRAWNPSWTPSRSRSPSHANLLIEHPSRTPSPIQTRPASPSASGEYSYMPYVRTAIEDYDHLPSPAILDSRRREFPQMYESSTIAWHHIPGLYQVSLEEQSSGESRSSGTYTPIIRSRTPAYEFNDSALSSTDIMRGMMYSSSAMVDQTSGV